jgi:glycerophosphoryl diester phosphodiesterase
VSLSTVPDDVVAALCRRLLLVVLLALCGRAAAFDLQGHRGTRGLEPENTLAAFQHALEIGVTTLEMDAAITADGVVVVSHDPALNPSITRDAQGKWLPARGPLIRTLSLAELQAYDVGRIDPASSYARQFPAQRGRDGEPIPTLAAVFARMKELGADTVRFDIETKVFPTRPDDTLPPDQFVRALLAVIREAGMTQRVMIQSFDWRTLRIVHQLEPGMPTMYLTMRSPNFDTLDGGTWTGGLLLGDFPSVAHMIKSVGGTIWAPTFQNLTASAVKSAKELGLQIIPWTVNEPSDMERLIGWGVDGLISDYPDRVREVMQKRGMPLPAPVGAR